MSYTKVNYEEVCCKFCDLLFKPNRSDKEFCSSKCYKKHGKKFKGHSKGDKKNINNKLAIKRRPYVTKKGSICILCGFIPIHSSQLDIDHIDGNHKNNSDENLQTICANCHRLKTATQLDWKNKPYQKYI